MILVPFEPEVRHRICRTVCANFGLGTSGTKGRGRPEQAGTKSSFRRCSADSEAETIMGRYMLLWLLGVPIPILLLIWAFGGLS
jgi:hypothetical protein